ncbi:mechanosensitive ion channel family protein [Agrococcus jejuensis]|uniref:Small conductance mechanosensitive channel n=1 Tax=Agrococcus jejuensis TaxID=399736 RepID=A0A1G8GQ96_9MICO|nr:mechanosensitive ion channel domain-containing protein [Agrococcus jejuensis]SDH96539.1 small conductance mechanosensitive channel [Agrococcus jejuensis]
MTASLALAANPDSPSDLLGLAQQALGVWWQLVAIVVVLLLAPLAWWIVRSAIDRVVKNIVSGAKRKASVADTEALQRSPLYHVRIVQRTKAMGGVLRTVAAWVIVIVTIIAILSLLGISGSALITAAGLFAAALGIGAQNVVKDVLTGLLMVLEDQLGIGDIVDLGMATGVVEQVGIRVTQVRDVNGTLWYVRNGEVNRVGNMSQGWARVVVDLGIPYEADVDGAQERILRTARSLAEEPKWTASVIGDPELWGIESVSADVIVVRVTMKVKTASRDDVARELRARLTRDLRAAGIPLPSLEQVVLEGMEGAASVSGARPPRTAELPRQD